MTDREVLKRAAEIAARAGHKTIRAEHLRKAEKELGETVEVKR